MAAGLCAQRYTMESWFGVDGGDGIRTSASTTTRQLLLISRQHHNKSATSTCERALRQHSKAVAASLDVTSSK